MTRGVKEYRGFPEQQIYCSNRPKSDLPEILCTMCYERGRTAPRDVEHSRGVTEETERGSFLNSILSRWEKLPQLTCIDLAMKPVLLDATIASLRFYNNIIPKRLHNNFKMSVKESIEENILPGCCVEPCIMQTQRVYSWTYTLWMLPLQK